MDNSYIRAAIAVLFAVLLVAQMRGATNQPWRKRTFGLASAGMLALAGYNALAVADTTQSTLQFVLIGVAVLFFAGAAATLGLAWRNGELRAGRQAFEARMRTAGAQRRIAHQEHHDKHE